MHFRWSAFMGVAFACVPTTGVIAQMHGIPLSDTIFMTWSGALDQSTLADNSILSEYVAQTFSENVNGASVQLAFVPRFNCSPMFSVILGVETVAGISDDISVKLTIDNEDMDFPAIVDQSASSRQYSYNGNREEQQKLRILIDNASKISMSWMPSAENGSENADASVSDTVSFSLLGSAMSTLAVEELCKIHDPIPY